MLSSPKDDRVFGKMMFAPKDIKRGPTFNQKAGTDVTKKERDL